MFSARNDINHSAMNGAPFGACSFITSLQRCFCSVKELISIEDKGDIIESDITLRDFNAHVIMNAIMAALRAHEEQFRKGTDILYILHPLEICVIVSDIKFDLEVICVAVLHDTTKDTHMEWDSLAYHFNDRIADF